VNPRLLDLLVKENLLSSDQAQKAVADQRRSGERLATVLTRLAFITEEELLDFLSRKYGIPVINLGRVEADPDILRWSARRSCRSTRCSRSGRSGTR